MKRPRTLVLALAMVAPAAGQVSAQGMFSVQSIRDELKITAEQAAKLNALDKEMRANAAERYRKLGDLPIVEQREKLRENARQTNDDIHGRAAEILSPAQMERFDQITVQSLGFHAFRNLPHVRERLKFTEDQVAKVLEVQEELDQMAGSRAALRQKTIEDPAGMKKKWEEASKQAIAKVVAIMTEEQKKTWADLNGPPFRVKFEPIPAP